MDFKDGSNKSGLNFCATLYSTIHNTTVQWQSNSVQVTWEFLWLQSTKNALHSHNFNISS